MATMTTMNWNSSPRTLSTATQCERSSDGARESRTRERMAAMRDTIIVLAIQLVFRATLAMRRWNY
jgi:hypothetical protein